MTKCIAFGCKKPAKVRHRFPHPLHDLYKRFPKWLEVLGNPILFQLDPMKVYRTKFVCAKHFPPEDVSPGCRGNLKKNVIPSLFLPEKQKETTENKDEDQQHKLLDIEEENARRRELWINYQNRLKKQKFPKKRGYKERGCRNHKTILGYIEYTVSEQEISSLQKQCSENHLIPKKPDEDWERIESLTEKNIDALKDKIERQENKKSKSLTEITVCNSNVTSERELQMKQKYYEKKLELLKQQLEVQRDMLIYLQKITHS